MKLLQLNCWAGKLATPIKRVIEREQPDLVTLQEAMDIAKRPGSIVDPFRDFLPEEVYPHTAYGPVFSARYMHEAAKLGNLVASKLAISSHEVVFTAGEFTEDIDSLNGDYNIRNFVHAVVKTPGGTLHIVTHHGYHNPEHKDGSPENTRQVQLLAGYVKALKGPVIVTGDFNLHPHSDSLKPLNQLLANLPLKYAVKSTRTELAKRQEVIDFIFVSPEINVNHFTVLDDIVSDHKALVLDFDI